MQASAAKQASGGIQASAFFALFLSLLFFLSVYFTLLFFFTQASPDSARHAFLAMICNDFNIKVVSATSKYTAISNKVVAKSARDNPERDCGWFWVIYSSSKKFKRMAREALEVCLWVLKESNKSRFDGYCVRNSVLIISHVTFRDCRVHIVSNNLSWNCCSWQKLYTWVLCFLGDWKTMLKI